MIVLVWIRTGYNPADVNQFRRRTLKNILVVGRAELDRFSGYQDLRLHTDDRTDG